MVILTSTEKAHKIVRVAGMSRAQSSDIHRVPKLWTTLSPSNQLPWETRIALCPQAKLSVQTVTNYQYVSARQPHHEILKPIYQKGLSVASWKWRCDCWETVPSPQRESREAGLSRWWGQGTTTSSFFSCSFQWGWERVTLNFQPCSHIIKTSNMLQVLPLRGDFASQPSTDTPQHFKFQISQMQLIQAQPKQTPSNSLLKCPFAPCSHTIIKNTVTRQNR